MSHEDFREWNPAVSVDCISNFLAQVVILCVNRQHYDRETSSTSLESSSTSKADESISTTSIPTKTASSANTTSSDATVYSIRNPTSSINIATPTVDMSWPPKTTQAGQLSFCNDWYLVGGFDTCHPFYSRFISSMTEEQL